jgi:hypothetical protein
MSCFPAAIQLVRGTLTRLVCSRHAAGTVCADEHLMATAKHAHAVTWREIDKKKVGGVRKGRSDHASGSNMRCFIQSDGQAPGFTQYTRVLHAGTTGLNASVPENGLEIRDGGPGSKISSQ